MPEIACAWIEVIVEWALHSLPWLPLHFSQFHIRLTIGVCRESDWIKPQLIMLFNHCEITKRKKFPQKNQIEKKFRFTWWNLIIYFCQWNFLDIS